MIFPASSAARPSAAARIRGGALAPGLRGDAQFYQRRDGVLIRIRVVGLPASETGFFALHIHEGGSCAGEGFPATGGHYNPGLAPHPQHAGDLPPLLSCHGMAEAEVLTDRFTVRGILGRTLVIHSGPDDFHTQPSGNPGDKIACGQILRV